MYLLSRLIYLLLICNLVVANEVYPVSNAFIDLINKEGKWTAGRNFHPDTPMTYIKRLLGEKPRRPGLREVPIVEHDMELISNLPENFDPRDKWPNCPSLNEIRNQGRCGSCWAFSAVEAMTDRVCTYSNGTKNFHFSAEDLLTCDVSVGSCDGGISVEAWMLWADDGIVSGGGYQSHEGCKPYTIPPCKHHAIVCTDFVDTPACEYACEEGYDTPYDKDKRRGESFYDIQGEANITAELFINGPVTASFEVYEDFINYKSGVYRRVAGKLLGGHAVKIIGYGVENGVKYWLAANSWGTIFGEKGFFKILRGEDECGIESRSVCAGSPLLEDYP